MTAARLTPKRPALAAVREALFPIHNPIEAAEVLEARGLLPVENPLRFAVPRWEETSEGGDEHVRAFRFLRLVSVATIGVETIATVGAIAGEYARDPRLVRWGVGRLPRSPARPTSHRGRVHAFGLDMHWSFDGSHVEVLVPPLDGADAEPFFGVARLVSA